MINIIKKKLDSQLNQHNFKCIGYTWNRNLQDITHVINLQKAKHFNPNEPEFTLNVGVNLVLLDQLMWGQTPIYFKEENCVIRKRPKDLGNIKDFWVIESNNQIEVLSLEILQFIQEKAFPFLNNIVTIKQTMFEMTVIFEKKNRKSIYADELIKFACVKYFNNEIMEAEKILCEVYESNTVWSKKAKEILDRLA